MVSPSSSNGRQKQGTLHNSEQAVWSKQGARMPSRFIVIGGTAMDRRFQANRRVATKTRLFLYFIADSEEATTQRMDETTTQRTQTNDNDSSDDE